MKRCAGLFKLEEICKLWIQLSLEKDMFGRWYLEFRLQSDVYQTLFMTNLDRVTFAYSCVIRELNSTWELLFNTQHCGRCEQANLVCGRREVLINKFVKGQRWYYMSCKKDAFWLMRISYLHKHFHIFNYEPRLCCCWFGFDNKEACSIGQEYAEWYINIVW